MEEETPGAFAYVFNPMVEGEIGYYASNVSDPATIGDAIVFDALMFPYAFSVRAFFDTGMLGSCLGITESYAYMYMYIIP